MERDDLHREVYRTQGKLTSCFGYDAMGRKAWQFASNLPADKLSQVHNTGINTSLLMEHAYNPIHSRYQYDPAGELVRTLDKLRGEIKYEYEANGQLRSRDTGSLVGSEEFRYDPAGNRLDFNARQFAKSRGLRMLREETPGQSILYLYEPGSYAPLVRVDQVEGEDQKLYYFHTDQIGTPLELTNSDGKIVWQATYRSWGAIESLPINEIEQNLRFQGQYFDDETGLHYSTFRYYDPEIGRFATQDPIGLLGGINLYQYAVNPLGWLDPLGWAGNPANATHIAYEGVKDGKPYIGYASKPGLGHSAQDVLGYRYSSTAHFDVAPEPFFVGDGQAGKDIARGLEQRVFEDGGGLKGTSNKRNPVGVNNPSRDRYLAAADEHRTSSGKAKTSRKVKGAASC
ncbi:RHS repeat-associated core domain-containing protein [Pseudomonas sp. A2]|uniref:RHS repeat domain-containing protein n=1 Tax=Pseudomonas sp. A2 TaxID=107445 RepID=UPI0032B7E6C3